jgi:CBS domain containing-hemolysin-like protein
MILYLVAISVFLLFAALFSAAEIAVTMANRVRLRTRAEQGHPGAARAERLLLRPERAIATCLVGSNLANIAIAVYGRAALVEGARLGEAAADVVATLVLVPLVLVVGETTPKALAQLYPNRMLAALALPLQIVRWLLLPLTQVSFAVAGLVRRLARLRPELDDVLSREELKQFVAHSEKHGNVDAEERHLIAAIVEFWRRDPRRWARRLDAVPHLDSDAPCGRAKALMRSERLGRLVIVEPGGRDVAGVVTAATLLDAPNAVKLAAYVQPAVRLELGRGVDRVLAELQRSPSQVGVVRIEGEPEPRVLLLDELLHRLFGPDGGPEAAARRGPEKP